MVHPQVSLRPESFGALAYHFGTRRLSFLKSRTLLDVVESLADQPTDADTGSFDRGLLVDEGHDAFRSQIIPDAASVARARS